MFASGTSGPTSGEQPEAAFRGAEAFDGFAHVRVDLSGVTEGEQLAVQVEVHAHFALAHTRQVIQAVGADLRVDDVDAALHQVGMISWMWPSVCM